MSATTSPSTTPSVEDIFSKAITKLKLSFPDQLSEMERTNFDDLFKMTKQIQAKQKKDRRLCDLGRISPFVHGMQELGKVIDVFGNADRIVPFVWGPMKLLLNAASNYEDFFNLVVDAYGRIGENLLDCAEYKRLFPNSQELAKCLQLLFEDISEFHRCSLKAATHRPLKGLLISSWAGYQTKINPILEKLRMHQELMQQKAQILNYKDLQQLLKGREEDEKRREDQEKEDEKRTFFDIEQWLKPSEVERDHQGFVAISANYPTTGSWLQKAAEMESWLDPLSRISLFWLNGIPGAGKTILASQTIQRLISIKEANNTANGPPPSSIAYFYCKYDSELRNTCSSILRTILFQILEQNLQLLPIFEAARDPSNPKGSSADTERLFKILDSVLDTLSSTTYLVIDGLDEISTSERQKLLGHLVKLRDKRSSDDLISKLKILLSSQNTNDMVKLFKAKKTSNIQVRSVTAKDNHEDTRAYIGIRGLEVQRIFDLKEAHTKKICEDVHDKVKGLFLLAHLIMENLAHQTSLEELEDELRPDILPSGLRQAYERILIRKNRNLHENEKTKSMIILSIVGQANRPIKLHEINGALSVHRDPLQVARPKGQGAQTIAMASINFEGRRLRDTARTKVEYLCDVFLEITIENNVEFVHSTARQFCIEKFSEHKLLLPLLCLSYLSSDVFQHDDEATINAAVQTGKFSFAEYSFQQWFSHIHYTLSLGLDGAALKWVHSAYDHFHRFWVSQGWDGLKTEELKLPIAQSQMGYRTDTPAPEPTAVGANDKETLESILYHRLKTIRLAIEKNYEQKYLSEPLLREAYGELIYKCPTENCPSEGFVNDAKRIAHSRRHERPFKCDVDSCFMRKIGFPTKQGLSNHKDTYHSIKTPEGPKFAEKSTSDIKHDILRNFFFSMEQGSILSVREDLRKFPGILSKEYELCVPLTFAIGMATETRSQRSLDIVEALLIEGADIETRSDLASAMHSFEFLEFLWPNTYLKQAKTLLLHAVKSGYVELVQLLLKYGANILDTGECAISDFRSNCPPILARAVELGNLEIVKLLLNRVLHLENAQELLFAVVQIAKKEQMFLEQKGAGVFEFVTNTYAEFIAERAKAIEFKSPNHITGDANLVAAKNQGAPRQGSGDADVFQRASQIAGNTQVTTTTHVQKTPFWGPIFDEGSNTDQGQQNGDQEASNMKSHSGSLKDTLGEHLGGSSEPEYRFSPLSDDGWFESPLLIDPFDDVDWLAYPADYPLTNEATKLMRREPIFNTVTMQASALRSFAIRHLSYLSVPPFKGVEGGLYTFYVGSDLDLRSNGTNFDIVFGCVRTKAQISKALFPKPSSMPFQYVITAVVPSWFLEDRIWVFLCSMDKTGIELARDKLNVFEYIKSS